MKKIPKAQDKQITSSVPVQKAGVRSPLLRTMKLRVPEAPDSDLEDEQSLLEGQEETHGILGSRAEVVSETLDLTEKGGEESELENEDKLPPKEKDKGDETLPDKFKGKTTEDVVKSYKEAEGLISRLAQTNVELSKALADLKQNPKPDTEIVLPDNLADQLLDNPKAAVDNLVKIITKQVLEGTKEYNENQDIDNTKKYLTKNHAELLSDEKTKRLLDALAGTRSEETYIERYKGAVEDLKSLRVEPKADLKEDAETEELKVAASLIKGKPGSGAKKIWKQSNIDTLLTDSPLIYAKLQSEITKAYLEKRVRRDL